jgi:hypothetical protein
MICPDRVLEFRYFAFGCYKWPPNARETIVSSSKEFVVPSFAPTLSGGDMLMVLMLKEHYSNELPSSSLPGAVFSDFEFSPVVLTRE